MVEAVSASKESFARKLMDKNSDLTASDNVLSAARTLVDAGNGIAKMKGAGVWAVPKQIVAVQMLPKHILPFISIYYRAV